jgi:hypothetical protein
LNEGGFKNKQANKPLSFKRVKTLTKFNIMKKIKHLLIIAVWFAATTINASAQEGSTGMPGDHFSLQGALEMFKQASSPEDFEKLINTADKNINNLDLNGRRHNLAQGEAKRNPGSEPPHNAPPGGAASQPSHDREGVVPRTRDPPRHPNARGASVSERAGPALVEGAANTSSMHLSEACTT